jgi:hypothetical protein
MMSHEVVGIKAQTGVRFKTMKSETRMSPNSTAKLFACQTGSKAERARSPRHRSDGRTGGYVTRHVTKTE